MIKQISDTDRMAKALAVIEGSLLVDEPEDKRFSFIYRMAHVGGGGCEHKDWIEEMENCYQQLIKSKVIGVVVQRKEVGDG